MAFIPSPSPQPVTALLPKTHHRPKPGQNENKNFRKKILGGPGLYLQDWKHIINQTPYLLPHLCHTQYHYYFFLVRIWEPITIFQKFPLGGAPFLTFQIFKNLGFSIFKKRGNRYFFTDHHKLLERSRSSFGFGLPITIHRFLIISVLLEASRSF